MEQYLPQLELLIEKLRHIPSVGKKTAVRMAFSIIDYTDEEAYELAKAIVDAKEGISLCPICFNLSEKGKKCSVCSDDRRTDEVICVVEDYKAVMAFERVRSFNGRYHVLHGVLSPLDGKGPEDLKIAELVKRVKDSNVKELIIATNPTVEGEATAMYIAKLFSGSDVKITRLAYGLPVGADLEYTDEGTLEKAFNGRSEMG